MVERRFVGARVLHRDAEVVVRIDVGRIEAQRFAQSFNCFVDAAERARSEGAVAQQRGVGGRNGHCAVHERERAFVIAELMARDAAIVERARVIWVLREDLLIERLCFVETARAVCGEGGVKVDVEAGGGVGERGGVGRVRGHVHLRPRPPTADAAHCRKKRPRYGVPSDAAMGEF